MKSKKKFEHELLNTVTNKIDDNNLNYQNIKSRINDDYKKNIKLSFSCFLNYALSLVIIILVVIGFIHIENENKSDSVPTTDKSDTINPGDNKSDTDQIFLNNDYYIEILFNYSEDNNFYNNNKKYYSKLGLDLNISYANDAKKAYTNLKGEELLNLQKQGLENELKKASEKDYVFDIIEYNLTSNKINNYYKKDFVYNNLIMKSNRFLNDNSEIKVSITLNYGDPTSEENNMDLNKNVMLQYTSEFKNNSNCYSSFNEPKIFYIYNSYNDFLKDYDNYLKHSSDINIKKIIIEQIS